MSKRLVAYFSASGVTAKVAENLADAIGADIFEIQPEVPYTKADLNWMDKKSRSTIEMSDPTSRPAIAAKRDNMDEYDTIFVGFPIWWYIAPTIINTFLEAPALLCPAYRRLCVSGGGALRRVDEPPDLGYHRGSGRCDPDRARADRNAGALAGRSFLIMTSICSSFIYLISCFST